MNPIVSRLAPAASALFLVLLLGAAPARGASAPTYTIGPGDALRVEFYYNPELSLELPVPPDGYLSFKLLGPVRVAGRTPAELEALLTDRYADVVRKPEVTVALTGFGSQQVYVGGEVRNPAAMPLRAGMTPAQAIIMAGGYKNTARLSEVIVIRDSGEGEALPMVVDVRGEFRGKGQPDAVTLEARDVVFVPPSPIAVVGNFVEQYVSRLVPSWFTVSWQRVEGEFAPSP